MYKWTTVKISYTDKEGIRHNKVTVKFENYEWHHPKHAYNAIRKHFPDYYQKLYVHEILVK